MNACEFQATVTPNHKLSIPDALFGKFETHKTIRVIVLINGVLSGVRHLCCWMPGMATLWWHESRAGRCRPGYDVKLIEWKLAGLLLPSVVRLHKLATLQKTLVERRLGVLTIKDTSRVKA